VGSSLHQLRVRDDVIDIDEDSNCCSMMDDMVMGTSVSQQHAAVMTSQIDADTGYQSCIMQTTGTLSMTTATASVQFIHRQHSTVDNVESFDRADDL